MSPPATAHDARGDPTGAPAIRYPVAKPIDQTAEVAADRDPGHQERDHQVDRQKAAETGRPHAHTPPDVQRGAAAPITPKMAPDAPTVSTFGLSSSAPNAPPSSEPK